MMHRTGDEPLLLVAFASDHYDVVNKTYTSEDQSQVDKDE